MSVPRYISPLRYPGGKARMAAALAQVFADQYGPMDVEVWMEPFAGGAGAGLSLLARGHVESVWLVEKNPALAAFWQVLIGPDGPALADRVERTRVDMDLWHWSRERVAAAEAAPLEVDHTTALAAFIVNRCSRSGIVTASAGPIGGKHQNSKWGVGDRFNGPSLAERLRLVHAMGTSGRLRIAHGDAIEHIEELNDSGVGDEVMLLVDPPYIAMGNRLYAHGMSAADHHHLAQALTRCHSRWVLTYDAHAEVCDVLYSSNRVLAYEIANSANRARVDWEYAVLSDNLVFPDEVELLPGRATRWVRPHERDLEGAA